VSDTAPARPPPPPTPPPATALPLPARSCRNLLPPGARLGREAAWGEVAVSGRAARPSATGEGGEWFARAHVRLVACAGRRGRGGAGAQWPWRQGTTPGRHCVAHSRPRGQAARVRPPSGVIGGSMARPVPQRRGRPAGGAVDRRAAAAAGCGGQANRCGCPPAWKTAVAGRWRRDRVRGGLGGGRQPAQVAPILDGRWGCVGWGGWRLLGRQLASQRRRARPPLQRRGRRSRGGTSVRICNHGRAAESHGDCFHAERPAYRRRRKGGRLQRQRRWQRRGVDSFLTPTDSWAGCPVGRDGRLNGHRGHVGVVAGAHTLAQRQQPSLSRQVGPAQLPRQRRVRRR
jgi:hypothetical protein